MGRPTTVLPSDPIATTSGRLRGRDPAQSGEPLAGRANRLHTLAEGEPELGPPKLGARVEGRARHGGHADLLDEVPGGGDVVVQPEERHFVNEVVSAGRLGNPVSVRL